VPPHPGPRPRSSVRLLLLTSAPAYSLVGFNQPKPAPAPTSEQTPRLHLQSSRDHGLTLPVRRRTLTPLPVVKKRTVSRPAVSVEHTVRCGARIGGTSRRAQANRCRAPEKDGEERCVVSSRIGWRPRPASGWVARAEIGGQEVGSRFEGKERTRFVH